MRRLLVALGILALVIAGAGSLGGTGPARAQQPTLVTGTLSSACSADPCASTAVLVAALPGPNSSCTFNVSGTFSATAQFEQTNVGNTTPWGALYVTPNNSTTTVASTTSTFYGSQVVIAGSAVRVRLSAYASGSVAVTIYCGMVSVNAYAKTIAVSTGGGGGGDSFALVQPAQTPPATIQPGYVGVTGITLGSQGAQNLSAIAIGGNGCGLDNAGDLTCGGFLSATNINSQFVKDLLGDPTITHLYLLSDNPAGCSTGCTPGPGPSSAADSVAATTAPSPVPLPVSTVGPQVPWCGYSDGMRDSYNACSFCTDYGSGPTWCNVTGTGGNYYVVPASVWPSSGAFTVGFVENGVQNLDANAFIFSADSSNHLAVYSGTNGGCLLDVNGGNAGGCGTIGTGSAQFFVITYDGSSKIIVYENGTPTFAESGVTLTYPSGGGVLGANAAAGGDNWTGRLHKFFLATGAWSASKIATYARDTQL